MKKKFVNKNKKLLSYIIGIALGDGNLSNPNGRATRLRITCDKKYPLLIQHIKQSIKKLLPQNKVSLVDRKNCIDISCYSKHWEHLLGWKSNQGSKYKQRVKIPSWIKKDKNYVKECLRGLFQTDGSIYNDRNYLMVNFVSKIPSLANGVFKLISEFGYKPNIQKLRYKNNQIKFTIKLSKDTKKFINEFKLWKT